MAGGALGERWFVWGTGGGILDRNGIPVRGQGSKQVMRFQTVVGFQSSDVILDKDEVPDGDGGVTDRDDGVLDM